MVVLFNSGIDTSIPEIELVSVSSIILPETDPYKGSDVDIFKVGSPKKLNVYTLFKWCQLSLKFCRYLIFAHVKAWPNDFSFLIYSSQK